MKTSYVFLAPGFEEIEALGTVDALRRGGITVKTVSITDENTVVGAHGIPVVADIVQLAFSFVGSGVANWLKLIDPLIEPSSVQQEVRYSEPLPP